MAEHGNQANDSGRPVLQLRLRTLLIWVAVVATVLGSVMVLTTAVERAREAAARNHCSLGQIALACRNYHDQHGELPPAIVYGQRGEPLYSWRVLILPCLEQQTLYDEFRLDEPWDSEHNIHLLERMPSSFAAPWTRRVDVPPGHTVCRVLVGPGTAFEERRRLRLADDFPDGTRKHCCSSRLASRCRGRSRRRCPMIPPSLYIWRVSFERDSVRAPSTEVTASFATTPTKNPYMR